MKLTAHRAGMMLRSRRWVNASRGRMGERYKEVHLDAVYCSALQRSYRSAEIGFAGRDFPIYRDARLNECNYGDLNGQPSTVVDPAKQKNITEPFLNGESYEQTAQHMKSFLDEIQKNHQGQTIMVIGHRATQYGLEHWIKGVPLLECITAPWKWQPGWTYELS